MLTKTFLQPSTTTATKCFSPLTTHLTLPCYLSPKHIAPHVTTNFKSSYRVQVLFLDVELLLKHAQLDLVCKQLQNHTTGTYLPSLENFIAQTAPCWILRSVTIDPHRPHVHLAHIQTVCAAY